MSFLFPLASPWRRVLGVSVLVTQNPKTRSRSSLLVSCGYSEVEGEPEQREGQGPAVEIVPSGPLRSPAPGPARLGQDLAVGPERRLG